MVRKFTLRKGSNAFYGPAGCKRYAPRNAYGDQVKLYNTSYLNPVVLFIARDDVARHEIFARKALFSLVSFPLFFFLVHDRTRCRLIGGPRCRATVILSKFLCSKFEAVFPYKIEPLSIPGGAEWPFSPLTE